MVGTYRDSIAMTIQPDQRFSYFIYVFFIESEMELL